MKAHSNVTDGQQAVLLFQMVLPIRIWWLVSELQVKGIPFSKLQGQLRSPAYYTNCWGPVSTQVYYMSWSVQGMLGEHTARLLRAEGETESKREHGPGVLLLLRLKLSV